MKVTIEVDCEDIDDLKTKLNRFQIDDKFTDNTRFVYNFNKDGTINRIEIRDAPECSKNPLT